MPRLVENRREPTHSHFHGLWADFRREIRASFGSFAAELPPGAMEDRGWSRAWPFARAMFLRLTPARRVILIIAFVLLASCLFVFGDSDQYPTMNRMVLSALCLLVLLALELADRVALKRDLELAREIQNGLVPATVPKIAGLDIAFKTRPANTVAGDYYDVLSLPGGGETNQTVLLVVADVAGKGIPAGLLMASFRSCLHTLVETTQDLGVLVDRLNSVCCHDSNQGRRFTSAFLAQYDAAAGLLLYVNAGQNPPLLRRASSATALLEASGLPFGMFPSATYDVGQIPAGAGDLLVMYTDGVVEAVNNAGDEYGFDRLECLVREGSGTSGECLKRLFDSVDAFTGHAPQHDDITCLIVHLHAREEPAGLS